MSYYSIDDDPADYTKDSRATRVPITTPSTSSTTAAIVTASINPATITSTTTTATTTTSDLNTTETTASPATTTSDHHQVKAFLASCNLSQYYNVMIQEGFDQLDALLEVTEHDLEQMGVKRGHRRLLQRAISNTKGSSSLSPLFINSQNLDYFGSSDHHHHPEGVGGVGAGDLARDLSSSVLLTPPASHASSSAGAVSHRASVSSMSGGAQTSSSNDEDMVTSENISKMWKRKYRRRAKADDNAPKKPPSAYVMFSNEIRAELKEQNLSFTTLSKITGDRWKNLDTNDRKLYEIKAAYAKEDYILALSKYELTDEHKQYQQYLNDFRMRHESPGVVKPRKRTRSIERRPELACMSPSENMVSDPPTASHTSSGLTNSTTTTNETPTFSSPLLPSNANTTTATGSIRAAPIPTSTTATTNVAVPTAAATGAAAEPPPPPPPEPRIYPYWLLNNDNTSDQTSSGSSSNRSPGDVTYTGTATDRSQDNDYYH